MSRFTDATSLAAGAIMLLCGLSSAVSQPANPSQSEPKTTPGVLEFTITAARSPLALQRTGSAISVVSNEEIAKSNPGSLVEALRAVPGLDITETGGPGATTSVRLRGANVGQTLVLVDGMRVNDPSGASGDFDFASLAPGLVERIEVLRGPQSALYGSDAIGGVINIITKKGRGPFQGFAQIEGGSYGTASGNAGFYGSKGPWNYSFAASSLKNEGFSRYGYRIGRLNARAPYEHDGLERHGAYGRVGYDPGTGFRFEAGAMSTFTRTETDAAFGAYPDTPNVAERRAHSVWGKAEFDTFDNRFTHSLSLFANRTDRSYVDISYFGAPLVTNKTLSNFIGDRFGAEYQGTLRLDRLGTLIVGGKVERETIETFSQNVLPVPGARLKTQGNGQDTRSLFALAQIPIGERLDVSFGGRVDDVVGVKTFATWRATAAYRITETGTKLRASVGTGGKAPTLFQLYSPQYGTTNLRPEESLGYDVGIDQSLLDGRIKLSATGFHNKITQLINFESGPVLCPPATRPFGCYVNVARAETSGLELAGEAVLQPDYLRLRAAYTYLHAKDLKTGKTLARRPEHMARASLVITPFANWSIEPSVTLVSERFSGANETQRLAPYARFDLLSEYRINEHWKVYARAENLTNARYQEVFNFGTTGRAAYAGAKATW